MQVSLTTVAGSAARPNEDFVAATPVAAVALDGLSAPAELGTGCIHSTQWYVARLGGRLVQEATNAVGTDLVAITAGAIESVADAHRDTCDLEHPGTPSASVALVRAHGDRLDYLVLFDSVVVVEGRDGLQMITDRHVDSFAQDEDRATRLHQIGTAEHRTAVSALVAAQRVFRNKFGGYWVAGAIPSAASEAATGSLALKEVTRVAMLTDGASSLVDVYKQRDWPDLLAMLDSGGPGEVMRQVRAVEAGDPQGIKWPRYKASDDASIVYLRFP